MNDTVKILYYCKYGAFSLPRELLERLNISYQQNKSHIDFSDKIRLNDTLIDFIENFRQHKKAKTEYEFLLDFFGRDNKHIYQIYSHIEKMDVVEVPRIAYECGAISYSEYDGKETIEVNDDKMILIRVKNMFQKLSCCGLQSSLLDEIKEIDNQISQRIFL